jgi:hypothetical protein
MKKFICLTLCLITALFFLTSCGEDEFDPDKYIGESLQSQFQVLVDANQDFYNNVFVLGHLPVDEKKTVEKDGKTFAPVTDSIYKTYDLLLNGLKGVYTEDAVADILDNYDYYTDIDGKLYFNMEFDGAAKKGVKWERDPAEGQELEKKTEDSYTLEFGFVCGKKDEWDEFTFVRTDLGYRLTKLQYVT